MSAWILAQYTIGHTTSEFSYCFRFHYYEFPLPGLLFLYKNQEKDGRR
jgi:hypothetical protein